MKKLIMLTLAIVASFAANASYAKWKFSSANDYAGYNIYICATIPAGGFTDVSSITDNLLGSSGNTGSIVAGRTAATASGTLDGLSADPGTTVSFYYVIVNPNDSTGYWTVASTAEAYTTAATHTDSTIGASAGNTLLSGAKTAWATGGGGEGGVPEPTSGMLLLVGGALLGLRRKRA